MHTPLTDIFWPLEENNDENIEEEVEEEKPEKEEENEQDTGSSKKEGEEDDDDEPNLWSPFLQKSRKISKKLTWKKSNSSCIRENPNTMPKMLLSMPYYL